MLGPAGVPLVAKPFSRKNFYSFRFSFDAKASPQVSMTCLEPVEELE